MEKKIRKMDVDINKNCNLAPLVNLSSVIPSLNTSPTKSNDYLDISTIKNDDFEVQFMDDELMSSSESLHEKKPKIPDGGWGWVVVFSSLVISMIADGVSFSFGLLYIEFLNEFGASKSTTAWIGSLFMAVPLLTGPIMSAFVDRYGCKNMTIIGGIISAIGFVLSSYAQSILVVFITFGVIAGLGLGLCYVTAVVSIAFWFDKKRNLAVGLGACGSGIGTFVYAPLTTFLIEEFGWRGTTLLLAGTFLHMCICGAVMRDPDWMLEENNKSSKKTSTTASCKSLNEDLPDLEEIRQLLKNGQNTEYLLQTLSTSLANPKEPKTDMMDNHRSVVDLPTFIKQHEKVPFEVLEQLSSNKRLYNVILENYPSLLTCRSTSEKGLNNVDSLTTTRVPVTVSMKLKKTNKPDKAKKSKAMVHQYSLPERTTVHEPLISARKYSLKQPIIRSDSLPRFKKFMPTNRNYLKNIKIHRNSLMYRGAMLNINKYRLRASSCPNIYHNSMTTLAREREDKWYADFLELLEDISDFSMFSELHFAFISIATILFFTWFIVPYFYLAEHLIRNGYDEADAANALSVIGIANTVGMILLGWFGDQPWMNVTIAFAVCLVFCGLSCIAMLYFTSNYVMLLVSSASFGFFFSSSYVYTPVMLVELINLERFTTAYGLSLLCQGIGNLIGPPLAGLLFDLTRTWDQSFLQAGIWIAMSALFIILIFYTRNRKMWGSGPLEKDYISEKDCEGDP